MKNATARAKGEALRLSHIQQLQAAGATVVKHRYSVTRKYEPSYAPQRAGETEQAFMDRATTLVRIGAKRNV